MGPRLLHTITLTFESPLNTNHLSSRHYAILSHRWARNNDDEVLFDDIASGRARQKVGVSKVEGTAKKAKAAGIEWIWIDTCCIDKRSSAELTETINSMYRWYADAVCCYVYLQDVGPDSGKSLYESEWFERGWTLQELIAPRSVEFYNSEWKPLGSKLQLADGISQRTGIHVDLLRGNDFQEYSIAQKMSWASNRTTTRPEDMAYCLLGIFDVNMVPIYGEGPKAFIRLQEELIKHRDDHTIFAWSMGAPKSIMSGLLAPSPESFRGCHTLEERKTQESRLPFSITNRGLSIHLRITPWSVDTYLAFIDCTKSENNRNSSSSTPSTIGIFLRRLQQDDQYARINPYLDDGLYWDCKAIDQEECDPKYSRPIKSVLVCVRTRVDARAVLRAPQFPSLTEGGFEINKRLLDSSSDGETYCVVPLGAIYRFANIDLRSGLPFKQIALGFDFKFNPICILVESDAAASLTLPIVAGDKSILGKPYDSAILGRVCARIELPTEKPDGIWRFKAHRDDGFNAEFWQERKHRGLCICICRSKTDFMFWKVDITHTDGETTVD